MISQLPTKYFALCLLMSAMLLVACKQDKPSATNDAAAPQQDKKNFSLGTGTDTMPAETQLQRYNAGLESLERYRTENAGKMTPEIEQELKNKIESAKLKIDSLTKIMPKN